MPAFLSVQTIIILTIYSKYTTKNKRPVKIAKKELGLNVQNEPSSSQQSTGLCPLKLSNFKKLCKDIFHGIKRA